MRLARGETSLKHIGSVVTADNSWTWTKDVVAKLCAEIDAEVRVSKVSEQFGINDVGRTVDVFLARVIEPVVRISWVNPYKA